MPMPKTHKTNTSMLLGEAVYGALDGTVTTFAVMAGALGANASTRIILIMAFANLFADGFAMSVGSFLSVKSQLQVYEKRKHMLGNLVRRDSQSVQKQLEAIYKHKGFAPTSSETIATTLLHAPHLAVEELLTAEGSSRPPNLPLVSALTTFIAFVSIGTMPVLMFLALPSRNFGFLFVLVGVALFGVGTLRSKFISVSLLRGGTEIMIAGLGASLVAYVIGEVLGQVLL